MFVQIYSGHTLHDCIGGLFVTIIPPKKMPDLLIRGTKNVFPTWKWEGMDFDSVKVGDSILKRKFESNAYYFKKIGKGKFIKIKLRYWTHL